MSRLGSQKKLTLVFNASSSSLSNCTSTFFECEYTVSILSKYVAFLSQNVTSNVIDRTKKMETEVAWHFCFFTVFLLNTYNPSSVGRK